MKKINVYFIGECIIIVLLLAILGLLISDKGTLSGGSVAKEVSVQEQNVEKHKTVVASQASGMQEVTDVISGEEMSGMENNIEVTEQDLMRHKKMWLASEIRISDRIDSLVNNFIEDLVIYHKPYYDRLDIIKNLSYEDLLLTIKELNFDNSSMVLMIPKNKDFN